MRQIEERARQFVSPQHIVECLGAKDGSLGERLHQPRSTNTSINRPAILTNALTHPLDEWFAIIAVNLAGAFGVLAVRV